MKIVLCIAVVWLLGACSSDSTSTQLAKVDQLEKSVDSIRTAYISNRVDTLGRITLSVMDIEFRIRRNYKSDSINHELGKKVNEFKMIRKKLKPVGKSYGQLEKGTLEEIKALKKLKKDIESGSGKSEEYNDYITFEEKKVNQLRNILTEMIDKQTKCLEAYHRLYPEMNEFSLSLIAPKK